MSVSAHTQTFCVPRKFDGGGVEQVGFEYSTTFSCPDHSSSLHFLTKWLYISHRLWVVWQQIRLLETPLMFWLFLDTAKACFSNESNLNISSEPWKYWTTIENYLRAEERPLDSKFNTCWTLEFSVTATTRRFTNLGECGSSHVDKNFNTRWHKILVYLADVASILPPKCVAKLWRQFLLSLSIYVSQKT